MGMFDYVRCKYPLPVAGANDLQFQTKDTPEQYMENYEIRENGTLWLEYYDIEDRSDAAMWERAHPGETAPTKLDRFCGCMTRVNGHWKQKPDFTDTLRFYTTLGDHHSGWLEFMAQFAHGQLQFVELVENRPIDNDKEAAREDQLRTLLSA
jgi:hypothetical protein